MRTLKHSLMALASLAFVSTAYAQTATPPAQNDVAQQLQKVMGKKNSQEALSQALVIGSLLGCTQKTAGKEATQAFYQQMETVGNTAKEYCKQNKPEEARTLLLTTFRQNKDNAVVQSALTCYDGQTESIKAIGGEKMATNAANYARWLRNPELAEKELAQTDVCKSKKQ